ncbi:response regulator [Methyloversatilis thermotolerans]|uniref:response regulator n=1 Tax=Methyloversatilis thermotolerans TaxID=1346290 RepID=UPI0003613D6C|nr:response regulator transcription factor [Methyloversatilis thermotolerans]
MINVLLVDDHPIVRSGYARLLEAGGDIHIVAEAQDADTGYLAFVQHLPRVTITDLSLPGSSGIELIRRIRARDQTARVLVFSVHDEAVVVDKAIQSGAHGFISKRSAPEVLLEAVRAVARGDRYFSEDVRKIVEVRTPDSERAIVNALSPREFEVFRLLAQGLSAAECAQTLNLSQKTVANYQALIKEKLNVSTSAALVHLALKLGIVAGSESQRLLNIDR